MCGKYWWTFSADYAFVVVQIILAYLNTFNAILGLFGIHIAHCFKCSLRGPCGQELEMRFSLWKPCGVIW